MRLAIEEINNSSILLPNITLGYHIWDTCQEKHYLQAVFQLAPDQRCRSQQAGCPEKVIGVVGPDSADMTQLTSRILTFYRLPQICYSVKDEIFTDKDLFPLLFRMVPNENHQISGLISLIKAFDWKWVSAVGSGTKASQKSVQTLIAEAAEEDICISYQGVMTADLSVSESQLQKVIENIEKAGTNVTIILSDDAIVQKFFQIVTKLKITGKVWIAPETWVLSSSVAAVPGIEKTGTVLGLTIKPIKLPQFTHFVEKTLQCPHAASPPASPVPFGPHEQGRAQGCSQACDECHLLSLDSLADILNSSIWHWSFYSYAAVYTLAEALHWLFGCGPGGCPPRKEFEPWQNNTIQFSDQGDLFLGYNVITWSWGNGAFDFKTIGSYSSQSLKINQSNIDWLTPGGQVPKSSCIAVCGVGQIRTKQLLDECLCRCDDCQEGTYQNNSTGAADCLLCPAGMWSPPKSSQCFYPHVTFLDMADTNISALVILTIVDFFLLCGCLLVFAINWQTPVVKAAGGKLAFVMLASLLASCASTSLFIGRPTWATCLVRQPFFAISFTLCVSCLLVRSFQIIFIFKMAGKLPRAHKYWLRYKGTYACVGLSSGLQAVLCALWLYFSPPTLKADVISEREVFLRCSEGHFLGLGAVLGYITLLGGACFVFAFWGRNLPKNYSEARLLTTSMLIFLMGWGCFMLIYTTTEGKGKQIAALQMFTVQTSVYAILCTFFLPKCYIVLFKPQFNTVAHFQTCIQAYTTTARNVRH
ncbi:taste receptor type 1 member 1-like isoform X2 [Rhineura floridana]|uniref:taste receptor type 1 member 1-like isoform X2 n=1 Tax=Rhineura floridana TaxID=261503 RepID=UPI002AC87F74|nr:taste receptor type 1 member 1-like isoform X2 [Rhineura floridana]